MDFNKEILLKEAMRINKSYSGLFAYSDLINMSCSDYDIIIEEIKKDGLRS